MGAALWRFWHLRGHLREGRGWLAQALALPAANKQSWSRAAALAALAGVAYWQQDYEAAERHYREALDIYRALGDRNGEAEVLYSLAYLEVIRGAADRALELYERSAGIWRELGNRVGEASASQAVVMMKLGAGRRADEAVQAVERAVKTFRQVGERFGLANSLHVLAMALREDGRLEEAIAASRDALGRFREDDNELGVAMALAGAASILAAQGRHADALRLGGAAAAVEERLGGGPPVAMRGYQDVRRLVAGALPAEEIERAWSEGRELTKDEACAMVFADIPSRRG
jgi:tetratricopeptide (TPR) repeat protein